MDNKKTVTDAEKALVQDLITRVVEPQINKVIEKLNEVLDEKGIQVGADLLWIIGRK